MLKVHELLIEDTLGNDHTSSFITNPDYQFLVVSYDLNAADTAAFRRLNDLFREVDLEGYSMIAITSSLPETVNAFKTRMELEKHFDFYFGDDVVLKSMVRANPGLMLLHDGIVIAKWHFNDLPDYREVKEEYMND